MGFASVIDIAVFYLVYRHGKDVLLAQLLGRLTAALIYWVWHRKLRPATLFAATGVISYCCIRVANDVAHIPVFRTKVVVEILLLLMTLKAQGIALPEFRPRSPGWRDLLWLLLLIPLTVEIAAFAHTGLLTARTWEPRGQLRFLGYTAFFAVVTELFGLYGRRYFYPVVVAAVVLCSIYAVGFVPVATVLLFVFSATVLGRLCFGDSVEKPLAFLAGCAFWIFAMYLTAKMPVHYAAAHLVALALPIAIGYRSSRRLAGEWFQLRDPDMAEFVAAAGLAFVLLANWLIVLKPEVSTDGLSMHLAVATTIARHHAFTIDFHQFVWALMPIGADFLYSVVYTIGGEYAARLLNFAMLAGIAGLLVQMARSFVARPVALLLAMLFVSTPMVYLITGSMFIENFVAMMVLGAVASLWRFHETRARRYALLTAVLLGASMALKLGAIPAGLIGLALLLLESPPLAVVAAAIALSLGSVPYALAWFQSGNPFFPFQTGPFKSSFVGNDIRDLQFNHPLSWRTPYDLTFHTSRYFEGQPGSFGFQYLLFLPVMLASFIAVRSYKGRSAILIGGGAALIVAATQPNARYFYFTLPLLTLGAAAALAWLHENCIPVFRAGVVFGVAACVANIWFLPAADWYHRDFYSSPLFTATGRAIYLHETSPEREVIAFVNRTHPNQAVLFTDGSEIADVAAPVDSLHWHDYVFLKGVRSLSDPLDVYRLFQQRGIGDLIVNTSVTKRWEAGVAALISLCGEEEFRDGAYVALQLRADCEPGRSGDRPRTGASAPH